MTRANRLLYGQFRGPVTRANRLLYGQFRGPVTRANRLLWLSHRRPRAVEGVPASPQGPEAPGRDSCAKRAPGSTAVNANAQQRYRETVLAVLVRTARHCGTARWHSSLARATAAVPPLSFALCLFGQYRRWRSGRSGGPASRSCSTRRRSASSRASGTLELTVMANTALWYTLNNCYGRHRRPVDAANIDCHGQHRRPVAHALVGCSSASL